MGFDSLVPRLIQAVIFDLDGLLLDSESAWDGGRKALVADTVVPGPGGVQLAGRVRERHPEIRTLIMSGSSERDAAIDVVLGTGTEFIAKPFSAADLNAKLAALLGEAASSAR